MHADHGRRQVEEVLHVTDDHLYDDCGAEPRGAATYDRCGVGEPHREQRCDDQPGQEQR